MGSTLKVDTRRAMYLERIGRTWDKRPDLTFGELLAGGLDILLDDGLEGEHMLLRVKVAADHEIARAIERFVRIAPDPPKDAA
jgi:hypothetical protein